MPFDEPGRVVGVPEPGQRLTGLLDGEGPHPGQVLLERGMRRLFGPGMR